MRFNLLDLQNQENLIAGVKLHPLKVNRDKRGLLVEMFKPIWKDVYHKKKLPRGQSYYSVTNPGFARDEDTWHYHHKQSDRFVMIRGNGVFALYDSRKDSPTYQTLNLFLMGNKNGDDQYMLLIPPHVLHSFCSMGNRECVLVGIPTALYSKEEEGRISFSEVGAKFNNGSPFSWKVVRETV